MMKHLLVSSVFSFIVFGHLDAQTAYEGQINYKKEVQPALAIDFNYPKIIVDRALNAKLTDMRLKGIDNKGFITYSDVLIPSVSKSKLDYTFKTEEKKAGVTTVYMLMEGGGNIQEDGPTLASNGKAFLEELTDVVKRSDAIAKMKQQESALIDEEAKLLELKKTYASLEEQLKKNMAEQEAQQKLIESKRKALTSSINN